MFNKEWFYIVRKLLRGKKQALKLGQHSPGAIGAALPSGHIFKSMVQKTVMHLISIRFNQRSY